MASLGDLVVNIKANARDFRRGMKGATGDVKTFGTAVAGLAAGAGVAGLAGLAGGVAVVRRQLAELDKTAKTASKLGLLPEKLSGLQFAFAQTGVKVDNGTIALQRFTRRLQDAAKNDASPIAKALREVGLSAKDLAGLPLDVALGKFGDGMNTLGSQGEKVALAFKLLDSEGVGLVNTLAGGSEGLAEMAAEAKRLGFTLSAVELKQIEDANNALGRLTFQAKAFAGALTVKVAPAITGIIKLIESLGVTADGAFKFMKDGTKGAVQGIKSISPQLGTLAEMGILWLEVADNVGSATIAMKEQAAAAKQLHPETKQERKERQIAAIKKGAGILTKDEQLAAIAKGKGVPLARNKAEQIAAIRANAAKAKGVDLPGSQDFISRAFKGTGAIKIQQDLLRIKLSLVDALEKQNKLEAETKNIAEQAAQQKKQAQQGLDKMRAGEAIEAARERVSAAKAGGGQQFAAVARKGTAAAFASLNRKSPQADQLSEQKKANKHLEDLLKAQRDKQVIEFKSQGAV